MIGRSAKSPHYYYYTCSRSFKQGKEACAARAIPKDKFISVNGLSLHYLDWGSRGAIPMVLLHILCGNAHYWDFFADSMKDYYHILTIDGYLIILWAIWQYKIISSTSLRMRLINIAYLATSLEKYT